MATQEAKPRPAPGYLSVNQVAKSYGVTVETAPGSFSLSNDRGERHTWIDDPCGTLQTLFEERVSQMAGLMCRPAISCWSSRPGRLSYSDMTLKGRVLLEELGFGDRVDAWLNLRNPVLQLDYLQRSFFDYRAVEDDPEEAITMAEWLIMDEQEAQTVKAIDLTRVSPARRNVLLSGLKGITVGDVFFRQPYPKTPIGEIVAVYNLLKEKSLATQEQAEGRFHEMHREEKGKKKPTPEDEDSDGDAFGDCSDSFETSNQEATDEDLSEGQHQQTPGETGWDSAKIIRYLKRDLNADAGAITLARQRALEGLNARERKGLQQCIPKVEMLADKFLKSFYEKQLPLYERDPQQCMDELFAIRGTLIFRGSKIQRKYV